MKAFPNPHYAGDSYQGMDLRDYFAAKAMQAFITANVTPANGYTKKEAVVNMAYETADAMMEERKK